MDGCGSRRRGSGIGGWRVYFAVEGGDSVELKMNGGLGKRRSLVGGRLDECGGAAVAAVGARAVDGSCRGQEEDDG